MHIHICTNIHTHMYMSHVLSNRQEFFASDGAVGLSGGQRAGQGRW